MRRVKPKPGNQGRLALEHRGSFRAAWPRGFWTWLAVLLALSLAAILHVRSRLEVVQLGYSLSEAATENRKLSAERRKLLVEVAMLKSPRRLRKLASEQLGLVEPRPSQILYFKGVNPDRLALQDDPGRTGGL